MILQVHHATLRVADLDEARDRWARLYCLTPTEGGGESALLRTAYEDFCLELRPERRSGDRARRLRVALGDRPRRCGKPDRIRGRERRGGRGTGPGRGLRLQDPDGNAIVLVERVIEEERIPPVARYTDVLPGLHPRKLQHFNYLTADTPRLAEWYQRVLGVEISDWVGDGAVWLHADRDHHVVAFLDKGYSHIHHIAFELVDWGEIRVFLRSPRPAPPADRLGPRAAHDGPEPLRLLPDAGGGDLRRALLRHGAARARS